MDFDDFYIDQDITIDIDLGREQCDQCDQGEQDEQYKFLRHANTFNTFNTFNIDNIDNIKDIDDKDLLLNKWKLFSIFARSEDVNIASRVEILDHAIMHIIHEGNDVKRINAVKRMFKHLVIDLERNNNIENKIMLSKLTGYNGLIKLFDLYII